MDRSEQRNRESLDKLLPPTADKLDCAADAKDELEIEALTVEGTVVVLEDVIILRIEPQAVDRTGDSPCTRFKAVAAAKPV